MGNRWRCWNQGSRSRELWVPWLETRRYLGSFCNSLHGHQPGFFYFNFLECVTSATTCSFHFVCFFKSLSLSSSYNASVQLWTFRLLKGPQRGMYGPSRVCSVWVDLYNKQMELLVLPSRDKHGGLRPRLEMRELNAELFSSLQSNSKKLWWRRLCRSSLESEIFGRFDFGEKGTKLEKIVN